MPCSYVLTHKLKHQVSGGHARRISIMRREMLTFTCTKMYLCVTLISMAHENREITRSKLCTKWQKVFNNCSKKTVRNMRVASSALDLFFSMNSEARHGKGTSDTREAIK